MTVVRIVELANQYFQIYTATKLFLIVESHEMASPSQSRYQQNREVNSLFATAFQLVDPENIPDSIQTSPNLNTRTFDVQERAVAQQKKKQM